MRRNCRASCVEYYRGSGVDSVSEITKTICDRCKNEIPDESFGWIHKRPKIDTLKGRAMGERYERRYDLCPQCEKDFEEFMGIKKNTK